MQNGPRTPVRRSLLADLYRCLVVAARIAPKRPPCTFRRRGFALCFQENRACCLGPGYVAPDEGEGALMGVLDEQRRLLALGTPGGPWLGRLPGGFITAARARFPEYRDAEGALVVFDGALVWVAAEELVHWKTPSVGADCRVVAHSYLLGERNLRRIVVKWGTLGGQFDIDKRTVDRIIAAAQRTATATGKAAEDLSEQYHAVSLRMEAPPMFGWPRGWESGAHRLAAGAGKVEGAFVSQQTYHPFVKGIADGIAVYDEDGTVAHWLRWPDFDNYKLGKLPPELAADKKRWPGESEDLLTIAFDDGCQRLLIQSPHIDLWGKLLDMNGVPNLTPPLTVRDEVAGG